jgi:hypothetical protein
VDITRIGREQVATYEELRAAGLTPSAIRHQRQRRHWQEPLPRVLVLHDGPLTWRQRFHAALRYVGASAQLTSWAVLALHRLRDAPSPARVTTVDVLLPATRRRGSVSCVRVHRTRRMPPRPWDVSGFPCAPLPRALADAFAAELRAGRQLPMGLLYGAVQQKRADVAELRQAFVGRQVPVTGAVGAVLADVEAGAHSVAEGWARRLISRSGLPQPLWNRDLYVEDVFLSRPDAYWPQHGVVMEVDSVRHHQLGADFANTVARHARMAAVGLCVIPVTPARLRDQPELVLAQLADVLAQGPHPGVGRVRVRV